MHALLYQMKSQQTKTGNRFDEYYREVLESVNSRNKFIEDLSIKCRVCLREGSISLYGNVNTEIIIEMMECYTNIQIHEEKYYPRYLCKVCYKFINTAKIFCETAKHVDSLIKHRVKQELNTSEHHEGLEDNYEYSDDNLFEKDLNKEWNCEVQEIKKEKKRVKYAAKVTCHICNKVINRSYYKEHVTMHDPDHKKYVCDVCGKSFRLRCAYHNHSLRHRTDFPYKCQFCPYRGRYAELLKTHMRTHTGDYRYMCTECPARFLFKSNLNSHMLKHKEPMFKCDSCKRAFHSKLLLQRHFEADHLGIKNHVCGVCGKAFGYRNAMMKHQRHVHKREKQLFGRKPAYLQADCQNQN